MIQIQKPYKHRNNSTTIRLYRARCAHCIESDQTLLTLGFSKDYSVVEDAAKDHDSKFYGDHFIRIDTVLFAGPKDNKDWY